MFEINNINEHFKLPIFYNKEKNNLKENIVQDLELVKTLDPSNNSIYKYIFSLDNKKIDENQPDVKEKKNMFAENIIEQIAVTYTTDTYFLKDTQSLLKKYQSNEKTDIQPIIEVWKDIKNGSGFKDKYNYIDWNILEHLNYSDTFLQLLSVYTMTSPILSLLTPIIILIIPFFIIKLKGLHLTMGEYMDIIKAIISNHALGKVSQIFTDFNSVTMEQKLYILLSAGFYIFSIYQNITTCIKFHQNMTKIHLYFTTIYNYLHETILKMKDFLKITIELSTYHDFNDVLKEKIRVLEIFKDKISIIGKYSFSLKKIMGIGVILKHFYEFYESKELNDAFLYSFGFQGYCVCLDGLIVNIKNKKINFTKFSKKKGKSIFKKSYYSSLIHKEVIKNDISFKNNFILTGPNASGKTTILKTTLINVLLSQQFGCGCYQSGKLYPFKYIHCYLNIPDTSGRDSLFQSEVRRCKEIIQDIIENSEETHFCVFDELYSGTNPEEAVISSTAFMEYIVKFKNVFCMLTTHFIQVCHNLDKNEQISNHHMDVIEENENNNWNYTYIIKPGISKVKGGIKILKDMNYPKEIIDSLQKNISQKKNIK
jgi:hypothetical protein